MSFRLQSSIRIVLVVIGVLGALFAPPWVPLLSMALLAFRYRAPEVFALGIFVDFLSLPGAPFFAGLPLYTIAAIVLVWGLEPLRNEFMITK